MEGIQVNHVSKYYGTGHALCALRDVSFAIEKGEYVSLIGESGSGKSTVARLLVGIERPSAGEILLDGEHCARFSFSQWRKRRHKIQAVFQDASGTLNPMLSVYHNLEESLLNLTNLDRAARRKRLLALMALVGMEERLLKTPVRQLSGGESRRLSLLRALSVIPDYLILDEVTSGLDLISEDMVLTVLERYQQEHACTCLFITHNLASAARISSRILEMREGTITRMGVRPPGKAESI